MFKFLTKQKQQKQNFASPTKRFLAYSIDVFVVNFCRYLILLMFLSLWFNKTVELAKQEYLYLANQGIYDMSANKDFWEYFFSHSIFVEFLFILSVISISGALYWIILPVTKWQGTLGKYLLKISIVTENNKPLTLKKAIYRYFVGLIPWGFHLIVVISVFNRNIAALLICMVIVVLWYDPSIFRSSRKTIHDLICKTKVCNRKKQIKNHQ